jgi:transcription factor TFIIIB component B''
VTPEDADQQKVDMRQVKMGDLVKDLKIGKKFSRHDELLERERKKKLMAKMRAAGLDPDAAQDDGASEAASAPGTPAPGASGGTSGGIKKAPEPVSTAAAVAPSFQIVDGQIVLNQASLQYDRHAAAADAAGEMEEEEEDEFTHHTTQNSYRRKIQKPNHWNDFDTEQFYDALRIFGTDFETIAKMFPGKNRRHLKLKFNREERSNPARINAALVGERMAEIDLEEFQKRAGLQLKPTDEILNAEQARAEALAQEEQVVEEEAAAEEARKREALFSKGVKEKEDEEDAQVKGRGRGRKKKQEGGFGMFG